MAPSGGASINSDLVKVAFARLLRLPFMFLLIIGFSLTYAQTNVNVDVDKVLSAIQMLIKHYQNEYKNLNLDGFFGLRVLEGQLELLISEHSLGRYNHLTNDTFRQINTLKHELQNLTAVGLEAVKDDDAQYFKAFNPIVSQPWKVTKPHRKLDPSLRWEIPQYKAKLNVMKKNFTEEASDHCMTEILSSDSHNCVVSETCLKLMTSRGFTGYPITHQVLWSMLVESRPKCLIAVEQLMQRLGLKSIDHLQLELCTNNFYEMVAVVEVLMHGNVHKSQQDLFLEQQFVCPSIGFYEFLKKDYLGQILSWQFPSGCFGEADDGSKEDEKGFIDFTSLLEEYNGDKLKFAPKMTVNNSDIQRNFDGKMTLQNASKIKKKETKNASKAGNRKQINNELLQLQSDSYKHSFHIREDTNLQANGLNKKTYPLLSKLNHTATASHFQKPSKIIDQPEEKNKLLYVPDGKDAKLFPDYAEREHSPKIGRHLLVEKEMSGGCLSHKTGVAAGALVMYLRYFINPGSIKWEGQHDLLLTDTRNLLQVNIDSRIEQDGEEQEAEEEEEEEEEEEKDSVDAQGGYEDSVAAEKILSSRNNVEGGDNEINDAQKVSTENANYEEEYEDNDTDEMEEMSDDNPSVGEDKKEIVKFDSAGHPVAPEGRLLVDDEENELGESAERHANKPDFNQYYPLDDYLHKDVDKFVQLQERQKQRLQTDEIKSKEASEQEEERHFYDDDIEAEREDTIRQEPPIIIITPRPPNKSNIQGTAAVQSIYLEAKDPPFPDQPNYTVLLLVSVAPFFLLFFFLFKFVRKRRVYIRYHF